MGKGQTKERRGWVYISPDDEKIVDRLVQSFGAKVTEAALLSVLMSAALKAYAESGYKFPVILKAVPAHDEGQRLMMNEPKTARGK
jgi:hypothetical protein